MIENVVEFVEDMYVWDMGEMNPKKKCEICIRVVLELNKMWEEYKEGDMCYTNIRERFEFDGVEFICCSDMEVTRGVKLALGAKEFDHNKIIRAFSKDI